MCMVADLLLMADKAGLRSEWPHVSGVDSRPQYKDELLDLLSRVITAN